MWICSRDVMKGSARRIKPLPRLVEDRVDKGWVVNIG